VTAMTIDTAQRVLIGNTSSQAINSTTGRLQISGTDKGTSTISTMRYSNNSGPPHLFFAKTRSGTIGTVGTSVQSGDTLGYMAWAGDDGTNLGTVAAAIDVEVDGTPGSNDMPGRMRFFTTADGADSPTERMRIDSSGDVKVEQNLTVKNQNALYFDNTSGYSPRLSNASDQSALSSFINNSESLRLNSSCLSIFSSGQFANTYGNSTRTNLQVDGSSEAIITLSKAGSMRGYVNATDSRLDVAASSGNEIRFLPNGATAEAITMTTGGNLKFTNGRGIDFSATGDATGATSEILDDYEEGQWTPTLKGNTSAGTATYTARVGYYTKIGNIVQISMTIACTSITGTGTMIIDGLPFSTGSGSVDSVFSMQWNSATWSGPTAEKQTVIPMIYATNNTKLGFRASDYRSSYAHAQVQLIGSGAVAYMRITGTYRVGTT